jgi:branched-chain amino acid aminotransferase
MALATWTAGTGWHDDQVAAYGPLPLSPAAAVLHYAQEVFEGLKAYRHEDGSIWSFRPEANAERMQRSCRRLALPELPTDDFVESLRALVGSTRPGCPPPAPARPASTCAPSCSPRRPSSGVRPANEVTYSSSPRRPGPTSAGGLKPVTSGMSTTTRGPGPVAPAPPSAAATTPLSLAGQLEGIEHGCDQAVFLDSGPMSTSRSSAG